ncbi:transcription factor, MADS-box [Tanacetum coccineum]
MGRGKVRMELINNEKKRKRAFILRKDCTFKKAFELATLCDVNVSMIYIFCVQESPDIFKQGFLVLLTILIKCLQRNERVLSFRSWDFETLHPSYNPQDSILSKSKKLDGRDSLRMPLNTPNPLTLMTCIDQNNNSFGSDHGVESSEPSNATAANRYKPLMLMGQNLLGHDSDSMAYTMTKLLITQQLSGWCQFTAKFLPEKKIILKENLLSRRKISWKDPTRFGFMGKHSVGELKDLRFGLGLKINQVKARIEFLKSKKSSKIDHNSINSFGSDHGVESSGSSNANVDNIYQLIFYSTRYCLVENLLCHESNSMALAMRKDDDNSLYDSAIEPEVVQQLEQPQIMNLLSCFRP